VPAIFRRASTSPSRSLMPKYERRSSSTGSIGTFLAVRDAPRGVHGDAAQAAALGELVREAALAGAGFRDERDDAAVAGESLLERFAEEPRLLLASDEAREAARPRYVEARLHRADALQVIDAHRIAHTFDRELARSASRK